LGLKAFFYGGIRQEFFHSGGREEVGVDEFGDPFLACGNLRGEKGDHPSDHESHKEGESEKDRPDGSCSAETLEPERADGGVQEGGDDHTNHKGQEDPPDRIEEKGDDQDDHHPQKNSRAHHRLRNAERWGEARARAIQLRRLPRQ
jgi:hypothetical protein